MKCTTYKILGIHVAMMKINGKEGGYIGKGRTVGEAIRDAFSKVMTHAIYGI